MTDIPPRVVHVAAALLMLLGCSHREVGPSDDPTASASAATPNASVSQAASASSAPTATSASVPDADPCASLIAEPNAPAATVDAAMWGTPVGDSVGVGRLGSTGARDGGRAAGETIGIGKVTGSGHGAGTSQGFANGHGQLGAAHHVRAPRVRMGNVRVEGGLSGDAVERVARQSLGRLRLCYESGRQKDPKLAGAVVTRFAIDANGAVSNAALDPCTTLPDADVTSCILRSVSALKFAAPDGGEARVVFPVLLSAGE